ncbi:DMT family transporter [Azospirillum agricola]|uniref:DMT family transporter n=1 Tax=Azospirillum agricola TaxID=1720247 RepID=UPI001CBE1F2D|nr:DMT family transporter [Azospirillum agricola]
MSAPAPSLAILPSTSSRMVEAVFWMLGSALVFAAGNAAIRHVTLELHPFQVVFFRNLFSLMIMLPWALTSGAATFRAVASGGRMGLYVSRSLTSLVAMMAWFYGVAHIPLATATAVSFATPLFVAIGAALFLGESVRMRRWGAIGVGFAGVLIVLRPNGGDAAGEGALLALSMLLLHCMTAAATILQMRTQARTDGTAVVVTYLSLFVTPMALVPALFVWVWPSWTMLGWLAALGALLTLGQLAMTRAMALAEASTMMPYDYARLPFSAVIAWLAFSETMDVWGWTGAAIIAGSAVYTMHRDATQGRRSR